MKGWVSAKMIDKKIWIYHMEKIMNEENKWVHLTEIDVVEGPIERVTSKEIVKGIRKMKSGNAAGLSEL